MHPEAPYLAVGLVALIGGIIRTGGARDIVSSVFATVALVIVASATANTKYVTIVRNFGFLILLATVIATINNLRKK